MKALVAQKNKDDNKYSNSEKDVYKKMFGSSPTKSQEATPTLHKPVETNTQALNKGKISSFNYTSLLIIPSGLLISWLLVHNGVKKHSSVGVGILGGISLFFANFVKKIHFKIALGVLPVILTGLTYKFRDKLKF